jgi:hypothetical protein
MNILIYEYQGFIEDSGELYIYIKVENNFKYDKVYFKNINWLVSINEILFSRKCFIYDIDNTVTRIFIKYPMNIHLYNNKNRVDIPEVAYYSTTDDTKQYNTYIGLDKTDNKSIICYNYDSYLKGIYIRVLLFLHKYIVPDLESRGKIQKRREIEIYKDNYDILSRHVI